MTVRLAGLALSEWDTLDGFATSRNMPELADLSLSRLCSFVYWYATNGRDQKDVDKFRNQLWRPPAGSVEPIPDESPWSADNETRAFAAFKAQAVAG